MPEHVPFVISHIVDQDIHIIDKLEQGDDFVKPAAVGTPAEAGIDRERNEKQNQLNFQPHLTRNPGDSLIRGLFGLSQKNINHQ